MFVVKLSSLNRQSEECQKRLHIRTFLCVCVHIHKNFPRGANWRGTHARVNLGFKSLMTVACSTLNHLVSNLLSFT